VPLQITQFTAPSADRPPAPLAVDWPGVEAWLGTSLPSDYKQLADALGPVDFGEYLWIHTPCTQDGRFDYGDWLRQTHRRARIQARKMSERERPIIHPEPGGLLAIGTSRGIDVLFWDTSTSADADEWTVVVNHSGSVPGSGLLDWHHYDLTLTEYLRHTVRPEWAMPSPPGPLIGPLHGTVARTAFLSTAEPWTPPAPVVPRLTDAERAVALETGTGLAALRLLSPPPAVPYLGDGDWDKLFDELGLRLPDEFVTLMAVYGAGCWSNWLRFLTPLRSGERRFVDHVRATTDPYREFRELYPHRYGLAVWPEPGGFLPFANSIDGDEIGWLTEGPDPNAWPLIVYPRHAQQGPALPMGLIDTLVAWQRGTFAAAGFAAIDEDDDPIEFASFEPWDDSAYW
jgi:hypothetical protein